MHYKTNPPLYKRPYIGRKVEYLSRLNCTINIGNYILSEFKQVDLVVFVNNRVLNYDIPPPCTKPTFAPVMS